MHETQEAGKAFLLDFFTEFEVHDPLLSRASAFVFPLVCGGAAFWVAREGCHMDGRN
jgi:hypothetical protein